MKKNKLRNLAIKLKILEIADNHERLKQGKARLGDGRWRVQRFNKFNPLTYLVLFILYTVSSVGYVFFSLLECFVLSVTEMKEEFKRNPFKWH